MALEVETIKEIKERIITDLEAALGGTVPNLTRNVLQILATVLAGALWLIRKDAQRTTRAIFIDTAESIDLDRIGNTYNIVRTKATAWTGKARMIRTAPDTQPQIGTIYRTQDNIEYVVTLTENITNPADPNYRAGAPTNNNADVLISLRANTFGTDTNRAAGETVTLITQIPNLPRDAEIVATTTTAVNKETDVNYRNRIQERQRQRPQGGSVNDYVLWAKEVAGVTRVWPYPDGVGFVRLYFVRENDDTRIPTGTEDNYTTEIGQVYKYIVIDGRIPLGANLTVSAPMEREFDVVITNASLYYPNHNDSTLRRAIANYLLSRDMGDLHAGLNIPMTQQQVRKSDIQRIVLDIVTTGDVVVSRTWGDNNLREVMTSHDLGRGYLAKLRNLTINGTNIPSS